MADRMRQVDKNRRNRQRGSRTHSQRPKQRPKAERPVFDQNAASVEKPRSARSGGMQQIVLPMGMPAGYTAASPQGGQERRRAEKRKLSRKEQRRRKHRRRLIFTLIMLLIAAAGIVLSSNVLFKVDSYRITDTEGNDPPNTGIYSEDAILAALNVHLGDNIYGFDPAQKAETMEQAMPYLESVEIRRRLPGTIVIKVEAAVPKYTISGSFGWAELSSRLKVLAVQADPFDEELTEIKLPVAEPVVGRHLQVEELSSSLLTDSFSGSEAASAASQAESSAASADAQDAVEEATLDMQQTFDELISLLEKESLLDGVTCLDMEDLQEITVYYQNRLVIQLGTGNNLDYKLQLTGVIVRNDDGNCLTDSDRGTLDVSYVKKDGTIEPVFRSENDIDITGALNSGTDTADADSQAGDDAAQAGDAETGDGQTAPAEE